MHSNKTTLPVSANLFWTMGNQDITIGRAISEFIDNSIDARINESTTVNVILGDDYIMVEDISSGMDQPNLINALTPARSSAGKTSVGRYGFGLKTASAFLGNCIEIETSTEDMQHALYVKLLNPFYFKEDNELETFVEQNWEIEVEQVPKTFIHGTRITITELNRPRYDEDLVRVKNHFSKTFSRFISTNALQLNVNQATVSPYSFNLVLQEPFSFVVKNMSDEDCTVRGWVGVSNTPDRATTSDTESGFHLYMNDRLLDYGIWIGLQRHPEMRLLTGEIFLDNFRSNVTKTEVIKDSKEWREFLSQFDEWLGKNKIRVKIHNKTKQITSDRKSEKEPKKQTKKTSISTTNKNKGALKDQEKNVMGNDATGNLVNQNESSVSETTTCPDVVPKQGSDNILSSSVNEHSSTLVSHNLTPVRKIESDSFKTNITIIKSRWEVVIKDGGVNDAVCDLNHHSNIMTLNSRIELFSRYLKYTQRSKSENTYSKHLLYTIFALYNKTELSTVREIIINEINRSIIFWGEE